MTTCRSCFVDYKFGDGAGKWKEEQLARQGGVCGLCGAKESGGSGGWHLDHNHETGAWRMVLCHHCNIAEGQIANGWDVRAFVRAIEASKLYRF